MTYDTEPRWAIGTDLKIVFDWQYSRYCNLCFEGICDWCSEIAENGGPCHCPSLHEHEYGSIE